jgi:DNA-binding CsgD family transcriptional regulator
MEVKIVCMDENYYFRLGIAEIVKELMLPSVRVTFLEGADSSCLQQADFNIINVSQWRLFMCQPAYRFRKPGSLLLVFTDSVSDIKSEALPVCYQALTVVGRKETIRQIKDKIAVAWLNAQNEGTKPYLPTDCVRCSCSRISLVQLQVLSFLKKGKSVRQIAQSLGLSVKTIYAHKYNVMKKFDIKGEKAFYCFLNDLSLLELYKGVVKDKNAF